jgi:hypothetical protein
MADATLLLRIVDGQRRPFEQQVLVTLVDGAERIVHRAMHATPQIRFTIPVTNGPIDTYRVTVSADNHLDAGQAAVHLDAGAQSIVDVMLLPRRGMFRFDPLDALGGVHANLAPLLTTFLTEQFGSADEAAYRQLQSTNPGGLATLLSISSAFAGFGAAATTTTGTFLMPDDAIGSHPLDFIQKLQRLEPDRFFATASSDMLKWLRGASRTFTGAPNGLHPGSFISFKEVRYPEGNVQFTFSKTGDDAQLIVDSDIDLFKDTASHLLLEVLPTDGLHVNAGTDPRTAYALRWMSVQRVKATTGLDFNPPFAVVFG